MDTLPSATSPVAHHEGPSFAKVGQASWRTELEAASAIRETHGKKPSPAIEETTLGASGVETEVTRKTAFLPTSTDGPARMPRAQA